MIYVECQSLSRSYCLFFSFQINLFAIDSFLSFSSTFHSCWFLETQWFSTTLGLYVHGCYFPAVLHNKPNFVFVSISNHSFLISVSVMFPKFIEIPIERYIHTLDITLFIFFYFWIFCSYLNSSLLYFTWFPSDSSF